MKFTSQTPDRWVAYYAQERRRRLWIRVAGTCLNLVTLVGWLTLLYFAWLFCSILEPGASPQLP